MKFKSFKHGRRVKICLLVLFVVGLSARSTLAIETYKTPKFPTLKTNKLILQLPNEKTPGINLKSPGKILRQCSTPDPALTNIRVGHVSTAGERPGFYEVSVEGEVVNAGQGVYLLNSRPIWAKLRESGHSIPGTRDRSFSGELAPGQSRSFYFRIPHLSSSADFIPEYTVTINMSGPDCNPQNNQKIITGAEISAAIAAYGRSTMQITRVRACVRPGRGVVIDGHNFGSRSPRYTALFGTRPGEIQSWTDRQLIIKAPTGLDPDLPLPLTLHATNQPSSAVMAHFGVRTCPSRQHKSAATPADFKFGTMVNSGDHSHARGERPLLVMLLQAPPGKGTTARIDHNIAYYDRMIFGPNFPNVAQYFAVNSAYSPYTSRGGHGFTWRKATIIGPVLDSTPQSTLDKRWSSVKKIAAAQGFDFSQYDQNSDGVVTESELGILVVDNYGAFSGITSGDPGCVDVPSPRASRPRISVCSGVSMADHRANMITVAHELSHQLGTIDIYGSTGGVSLSLSLMGGTADAVLDKTFNLDPWHRSRLGWIKPRIFNLSEPGSAMLRAPSDQYGESYNGGPIILYDPHRRSPLFPHRDTQEYFIVEYRSKQFIRASGGHPDLAYGYDASIPHDGVSVWHVKTDAAGNLISIPDRIPESINHRCANNRTQNIVDGKSRVTNRRIPVVGLSCGDVMSNVHISPPGRGGLPFGWGGNVLLQQRDGALSLNWLNNTNDGDGDDVGIRLKVYDEGKGYAKIRWDPRR